MDHRDKTIIDILKSIDESLKIIAGRSSEPKMIKKTYAEKYFAPSEDNGEKK